MNKLIKTVSVYLGIVVVAGAGAFWYFTQPVHIPSQAYTQLAEPDLKNGETVFWAAGCASCHAAPDAKGENRLILSGGHELHTDFGTFIAPNISPSTEGIGEWTLAEFSDAMMKGVGRDNKHLYPAFPYTSYTKMKLQDVADLYGYLHTLPPSEMASAPHQLSFPFNIRRGLGLWKMLYLTEEPVVNLEQGNEQLKRGQYLVEAMGHCGECHTPRTMAGGMDRSQWLAGALSAEKDANGRRGTIPNITTGEGGISGWSNEDIAYAMESGFTPDFDSLGGSMTDVVTNLSHLSAADREAIALYLKTIPPHKDGY